MVELSKRFVFAMASLCFVLIGIPLGIRSQRKESTIGMAIAASEKAGPATRRFADYVVRYVRENG